MHTDTLTQNKHTRDTTENNARMTNVEFSPIATIHWSLHTRLIPAYVYQQILTCLYFVHAFLPSKLQQYMHVASEGGYGVYQSIFQPLWQQTAVKVLAILTALPLLSLCTVLILGGLAVFWPLIVVGCTCSVISFTSALLMLNKDQISSTPSRQFAFYLLTQIPLACLGYIFSPILWCSLFIITAYHTITNPKFSSMPSLSTAGSRWLGLGCGLLLITAPYWTIWHIITFPLLFCLSWLAQFWTFVACNLIARLAPQTVDAVYQSYSEFVGKHSRSIFIEKDHVTVEKTSAHNNVKETYERMQKIEHHS